MAEITDVWGNIRAGLQSSISDTEDPITVDKEFTDKDVASVGFLAIGNNSDYRDSTVEYVLYTGFTRNGDGTSDFSGLTRGFGNTTADTWATGVTVSTNAPGALFSRLPAQDEPFDLGGHLLRNILYFSSLAQSSVPSSPSEGDFYVDDGTNTSSGNPGLRQYSGGSWNDYPFKSDLFSGSHTDLSDVSTGDHRTDEQIQDLVDALLIGGTNVTLNYDNAGNTLTINSTDTDTRTDVSDGGALVVSDVTDINFGSLISVSDDGDGTVTITGTDTEKTEDEIEDIVNGLLVSGNAITLTYNDTNGTLGVDVDESGISLANLGSRSHSDLSDAPADAHHSRYTDSEAETAINNDADHGSTADHDYFSGSHNDLSDVGSTDHHDPANQDVESVDGYDIAVVDSLPGTPDSNTLYFVRE